jgi:hypothetical protein
MNYRGPGKYRHYKGGEYFVLGLALQENDLRKTFVIYKPLQFSNLLDDYKEDFWARELDDFNAQVRIPHGQGSAPGAEGQPSNTHIARFTFIGAP